MRLVNGSIWATAMLICLAACGDDTSLRSSPATNAAVSSGPDTTAIATPTTGTPLSEATSAPAETTSVADSAAATVPYTTAPVAITNSSVPGNEGTEDPADRYLGDTTEIYRRTLPDGQDFVVRLSDEPYATVFGLSWNAPTGSAETCLGDHAVFLGVPGDIGPWGSAWVAGGWSDDADPAQPAALQHSMMSAESPGHPTMYLLIRTAADATEVVVSSSDGTALDQASVANRVAMVAVGPDADGGIHLENLDVTVVAPDGTRSTSTLRPISPSGERAPANCGPGESPRRPLPEPGPQPADPATAEAQIRDRYLLLVDQSIPPDEKPTGLLDDNTGVDDAVEAMHAGPYSDAAASATHSIDELVFTKPDEAWFRYTITTSTGVFPDRFGIAVFNGAVWQTTRATICQDLALAGAPCQPTPPVIESPSTPEWEAAVQDWMARANQYLVMDGCPPLSQC